MRVWTGSIAALASTEEHTTWAEAGGQLLFGLFFLLILGAIVLAVRTVWRSLDGPSVSHAGRPSHLTHPCAPPQERRPGARWVCPVCSCPWVVRQSTRLVPRTYSTGVPPQAHPLETRNEPVTELQWVFDGSKPTIGAG